MLSTLMSLGEEVYNARKARRWSQEELAERANISAVHLGYIERGKRKPSDEVVKSLARALGKNVNEWLLLAGYAPEPGSVSTEWGPLLNTWEKGYRPTPDEEGIMAEAEAEGIWFSAFNEPGFWELEPCDPMREDAFLHLKRLIHIRRRTKGSGK